MPIDTVGLVLIGVAAIFGVAYAVGLWRRGRLASERHDPVLETVGAVVIACGFAVGQLGITEPWAKRWDALELQPMWISLAALVGGILLAKGRGPLVAVGYAVVIVALTAVGIWPGVSAEWSDTAPRVVGVLGLAVLAAAVLVLTTTLARRVAGPTMPLALIFACAAAGALSLLSRYSIFTLLSAVLVVVLCPSAALLCWKRQMLAAISASLVGTAVLLTLALGGYLHTFEGSRSPAASFLLVGTAPAFVWIAEMGGLKSSPRRRAVVRLLCMTLPVLVALALAWWQGVGDAGEMEY